MDRRDVHVGDILIGNDRASCYHVTRPGRRVVVTDIDRDGIIVVCEDSMEENRPFFVDPARFDLVSAYNETEDIKLWNEIMCFQ